MRGQAQSYYTWQLAIAACYDVLSHTNGLKLDGTLDVDQGRERQFAGATLRNRETLIASKTA